ncbi:MAG: Fe-S-containing protein [Deltaproteobacteria bacterium]|jgi:uncharacterized membrane protein|nr:Fe-S-containing protein [Deltaproteobacteria bacterium]
MLLYVINVVDSAWILAVGAPMILFVLRLDPRPRLRRRLAAGSFALGLASAGTLAALRLNTGWVIREFYDLGVLVPAVALGLVWLAFSASRTTGFDGRRLLGRLLLDAVLAATVGVLLGRALGLKPALVALTSVGALAVLWPLGALCLRRLADPLWPVRVVGALFLALLTARAAPNLFLYPFEWSMGMDSIFNMDYLGKLTGYLVGLTVTGLVWLSVGRLIAQAPRRAAAWFLLAGLLVLLAQLTLESFQILAARRLLPGRALFSLVLFFLERKNWFMFGQAAVWGLLAAWLMVRSRYVVPVGPNPAVRRKMKAALRRDFRTGALLALAMVLSVSTATVLRAYNSREAVVAEPDEVLPVGDRLEMDLAVLGDGNLHRLFYRAENGVGVRFIVIKKGASAYGVGLDACDICGASGYYQRGDQVICKLCDVVMNKSTIGFPGGCNPVPLKFSIGDGRLLVDVKDLENERHRFE